ncbi:MAG: LacI family transcriptional regulator [Bacteroidales bacterium]|nr:LacI family transcriptional regulator [Bacteroidales bacterium]
MAKSYVTLSELAEALNLSKQLVKIVVSGQGDEFGISKITQETIIKKAQELGFEYPEKYLYYKSEIRSVSFLTSPYLNCFYLELFELLRKKFIKENINFLIQFIDNNNNEKKLISFLLKSKISAVIIDINYFDEAIYDLFKSEDIITIQILNEIKYTNVSFIGIDCEKMMNEVLNYIIDKGHKKIAFINYTNNNSMNLINFIIYKKILEEKDLYNEYYYRSYDQENYFAEILKFLRECKAYKVMPTCIIVPDENAVLKLFDACKELKITIPSQLSVFSLFDSKIFNYLNPQITSVSMPVITMANKIYEYILKELRTTKKDEYINLKMEANLILRSSVLQTSK